MLADREHVKPYLFGLLRDLHDRVDPLRLGRRLPRHRVPGDIADREDPELHGVPPTLPAAASAAPDIYAFACISSSAGARIIPPRRLGGRRWAYDLGGTGAGPGGVEHGRGRDGVPRVHRDRLLAAGRSGGGGGGQVPRAACGGERLT